MALLRFQRHRRDRARLQAGERDGFAGHRAIAIFTLVYPANRRIDLGDQLALAVAGAKLDRPVGLARCAIGQIGFAQRPVLQMGKRRFGFGEDRFFPGEQQAAKIFLLPLSLKMT